MSKNETETIRLELTKDQIQMVKDGLIDSYLKWSRKEDKTKKPYLKSIRGEIRKEIYTFYELIETQQLLRALE